MVAIVWQSRDVAVGAVAVGIVGYETRDCGRGSLAWGRRGQLSSVCGRLHLKSRVCERWLDITRSKQMEASSDNAHKLSSGREVAGVGVDRRGALAPAGRGQSLKSL